MNDCIKMNLNNMTIKKLKAHLRMPRMNHSLLYIDELDSALIVGGENESGS